MVARGARALSTAGVGGLKTSKATCRILLCSRMRASWCSLLMSVSAARSRCTFRASLLHLAPHPPRTCPPRTYPPHTRPPRDTSVSRLSYHGVPLPLRLACTDGHGEQAYFSHPQFPTNMPQVWWQHWARIPSETGHAVIVGEWGGLWSDTTWNGRSFPATQVWQQALTDYLIEQGAGSFYWTLKCVVRQSRSRGQHLGLPRLAAALSLLASLRHTYASLPPANLDTHWVVPTTIAHLCPPTQRQLLQDGVALL